MNRYLHSIYLAFFLNLLLWPVLKNLVTDRVPLLNLRNEYRMPAEFRDFLIMTSNQIDYSIFGISEKILLGDNDWFFQRVHLEGTMPTLERAPAAKLDSVYLRLVNIKRFLTEKGVRFIIIPIPLPTMLYKEFLPSNSPSVPQKTRFEKYVNHLKYNTGIEIIDVLKIFEPIKNDYQLFYKTDFHWTEVGAYIIASELLQRLVPNSKDKMEISDLIFTPKYYNSGVASMHLALYKRISETAPVIERNADIINREEDSNPHFSIYINKKGLNNHVDTPNILLFGDSFATAFVEPTGLLNHLGGLYFNKLREFQNLQLLLSDDVDVVVLLHVEFQLLKMTEKHFWPDVALKQ